MKSVRVLKPGIILSLSLVLIAATFGTTQPAQASTAMVNAFRATCRNFSVDVTLSGLHDDGGGFDAFRYMVVDGSGKTLYAEDSSRQTGITDHAAVVDVPYMANALEGSEPVQNPITFLVIDLDANHFPGAVLQKTTFDAPCLASSGAAVAGPANFMSLVKAEGTVVTGTPFYYQPGQAYRTDVVAKEGSSLSAVYRSVDDKWVSVLVSPSDMLWVPSTSVSLPLWQLPVQPARIDLSQTLTGAVGPVGVPVGNALIFYTVRLRAAPNVRAATLTIIQFNTTVTVLGTNSTRSWYQISYNGTVGWISAAFARLLDVSRRNLPIIQ